MCLIDEHWHPPMKVPPERERLDEQQGGRPAQRRGIDLPRVDDDILHEDGETRARRARYEVDIPPKVLGSETTESPRGFAATILSRMASKCAAFWLRIVGDANLSSETTSEVRVGALKASKKEGLRSVSPRTS